MDSLGNSMSSDDCNSTIDSPSCESSKDLSKVLCTIETPDNPFSSIGELTTDSLRMHSGCDDAEEIKTLDLSNIFLSEFTPSPTIDETLFLSLEFLDLSNNNLRDISAVQLCQSLTELRISENLVEDLTPVSSLLKLEVFIADSNKIKSIASIDGLCYLHTLDVSDNQIINFQETFATLRCLQTLRMLNVDKCAFFLKTPKAFDMLAYAFILETLNGVDLKKYCPKVDSKVIAKIKALIKSTDGARTKNQDDILERFHSSYSSSYLNSSDIPSRGQVSSPF